MDSGGPHISWLLPRSAAIISTAKNALVCLLQTGAYAGDQLISLLQ